MFDNVQIQNALEGLYSAAFLAAILRVTTPILFASLGALISDRAGAINIGLEGIMLSAAFTGVVFSAYAQDWWGQDTGGTYGPWLGLAMGLVVGVLMALLLAFFHLKLKANLVLSGIALNTLGSAATIAAMYEITGEKGNTLGKLDSSAMPFIQLPNFLDKIPVVSFFFRILDNQSVMTWIAFVAVILVWYFMYRMPTGIHLRAVGENPAAAASVGIRVTRIRYLALVLSGVLAALGGIHMSMGYLTFFQSDMTAGRGFIALATPALGGNNPIGTGLASLVFGFFDALSNRVGVLIPSHLTFMLPHIATVMALVIYALQAQLTIRVRTLRAAEGEGFDVRFWKAIQRLSVLHMFVAMIAIIGIISAVSMFSAPAGFKTTDPSLSRTDIYYRGIGVGVLALVLIGINLPFMLKVERIGHQVLFSGIAAILTLWLYLGIMLSLGFSTTSVDKGALPLGFALGLVAAAAIWWTMGGGHLLMMRRQAVPAAA